MDQVVSSSDLLPPSNSKDVNQIGLKCQIDESINGRAKKCTKTALSMLHSFFNMDSGTIKPQKSSI